MRSKTEKIRGIRKIRDGLYLIRVQRKDPRNGMPLDIRRQVECASLSEAVAAQAKLVEEAASEEKPQDRMRLKAYAASWLSSRLPTLKPSTRARYAETLDLHILPDLGDYYLDAISPEDVQNWFARKAVSCAPSTVNGYLRLLKSLMADAVAQYSLTRNPTQRIRAMPERRQAEMESDDPVNLLTAEEMAKFLAALKTRWPQWYAMVFVQFATARRFGEVSALRWDDVNEERKIITIRRAQWRTVVSTPKTDRVVKVPLTDELQDVLGEWRQQQIRTQNRHLHTGLVFPSEVGRPHHNASCFQKPFIDCLKVIGVERRFSSHGLRRTANDLLRRVTSGEVTRAITGHVTAAMTEHYSHVDAGEKQKAAESMLKLVKRPEKLPSKLET